MVKGSLKYLTGEKEIKEGQRPKRNHGLLEGMINRIMEDNKNDKGDTKVSRNIP